MVCGRAISEVRREDGLWEQTMEPSWAEYDIMPMTYIYIYGDHMEFHEIS